MKKYLLLLALAFVMVSCHHKDDPEPEPVAIDHAILMYMPWSDSDIYSYFLKNIQAMKTSIEYQRGLGSNKMYVLIASNNSRAYLIDLKYEQQKDGSYICVNDTLKEYAYLSGTSFTTSTGIASFFQDVANDAKAQRYSLIVSCHGMGWLPVGTSFRSKEQGILHNEAKTVGGTPTAYPKTRYFGSSSDERYQAETSTLREAIQRTFGHLDFLLFDDCYMQNIEVAYELKDVTDYLIASTCEVMIDGMPYATVGRYLFNENYQAICQSFYDYYINYKADNGDSYPCGTLSVVKCSEVEATAALMKGVNASFEFDYDTIDDLQALDGLEGILNITNRHLFFDMGDYVRHLCKDESRYQALAAQLERLVPYKVHTGYFYSVYNHAQNKINTYSGITISDPTMNSGVGAKIESTQWWKATH